MKRINTRATTKGDKHSKYGSVMATTPTAPHVALPPPSSRPPVAGPDMSKYSAVFETITPALATRYLGKNSGNRPTKTRAVRSYTNDMETGHWYVTGDTIKFDEEGILRDGQHRLYAIIESGKAQVLLVVRGLSKEAMKGVDKPVARGIVDWFKMIGNSDRLGAKKAQVAKMVGKHLGLIHFSIDQIEGLLARWSDDINAVVDVVGTVPRIGNNNILAALVLARKTDPIKVDDFVQKMTTGEDIRRGQAVYAFRERVIYEPTVMGNDGGRELFMLTCGAIDQHIRSRPDVRRVQVSPAAFMRFALSHGLDVGKQLAGKGTAKSAKIVQRVVEEEEAKQRRESDMQQRIKRNGRS